LLSKLLANVALYSTQGVDNATLRKAILITQNIDVKDSIYIAFCLAFDGILWTGDMKLYRGLRRNGFMNVVTTKELTEILKGV